MERHGYGRCNRGTGEESGSGLQRGAKQPQGQHRRRRHLYRFPMCQCIKSLSSPQYGRQEGKELTGKPGRRRRRVRGPAVVGSQRSGKLIGDGITAGDSFPNREHSTVAHEFDTWPGRPTRSRQGSQRSANLVVGGDTTAGDSFPYRGLSIATHKSSATHDFFGPWRSSC